MLHFTRVLSLTNLQGYELLEEEVEVSFEEFRQRMTNELGILKYDDGSITFKPASTPAPTNIQPVTYQSYQHGILRQALSRDD